MTVLDPTTGFPSVGRLRCTLAELEAEFMTDPQFAGSATRPAIWGDFLTALDLLAGAVKVHAVWLAGSFISSKLDPNDIDAVFIINARDLSRRTDDDRLVVASFVEPKQDAFGKVGRAHGLNVDSFLLHWTPSPQLDWQHDLDARHYAAARGYWDDFWCRTRTGQKHHPVTWKDALPARGYLEVMVNDYTR